MGGHSRPSAGVTGSHHLQGRMLCRGEVDVPTGDRADERQLKHLREPLCPDHFVAEGTPERLVEAT
jgi:hypothetical protein